MKRKMQAVFDDNSLAKVTFTISDGLHKDDGGGGNFLIEIDGKISLVDFEGEEKEAAGKLRASLVQFNQAQAQGISSRLLGDGQCLEIREYWCELFRGEEELDAEIQRGWQTEGNNLLIIASLKTLPKFEAYGVGLAALARTIEVFGPGCNLVACNPDAMLRFTDIGSSAEELRTERTGALLC
jgi:hypothetical protein